MKKVWLGLLLSFVQMVYGSDHPQVEKIELVCVKLLPFNDKREETTLDRFIDPVHPGCKVPIVLPTKRDEINVARLIDTKSKVPKFKEKYTK